MAVRNKSEDVQAALAWLKDKSTQRDFENLTRFGIAAPKAFGVSMRHIQALAKLLGRDHELAAALWDTGYYEARLLTAYVDEPAMVTPAQMDLWCNDFDNWGICDTLCFSLFDKTPYAWSKVAEWGSSEREFVKRAGFALLASLAGHDKKASPEQFLAMLPLIERGAADDRNFVKKGVSWALRRIGTRGPVLKDAALTLARRLAESKEPAARLSRAAIAAISAGMSISTASAQTPDGKEQLIQIQEAVPDSGLLTVWVKDASGAGIPNATVQVTGKSSVRASLVNAQGTVPALLLLAGNYSLQITSPGFVPKSVFIQIAPGGNTNVEAVLAVEESVTVGVIVLKKTKSRKRLWLK